MFYSLPAETVFEAKERTRRATFYFFMLLVFLYAFFVDLMAAASYMCVILVLRSHELIQISLAPPSIFPVFLYGTPAAVLLATLHFFIARNKPLDDLLESLGAKPADPKDTYHRQFIDIVEEAEAATGIHGIRPVVLSTVGCNAFSLQDGQGRSAIGVTDGLLSKLTREEISAVVAHEAAHLVHQDSRLVTTACFLFGFFGSTNEALGGAMRADAGPDGRNSNSSGSIWALVGILWIISGTGYFITKLVFMAISREREYLADADGVALCKDPLAMAESLYKISRRYRGAVPDSYSSLFILNPGDSAMDEKEGFLPNLFSNHPPVSERLSRLLLWARADIQTLQSIDEKEEKSEQGQAPPAETPAVPVEKSFMAYQGDQWKGPFSPAQLLAGGLLNPSSWVCPAGGQQVMKASESVELAPLFQAQVQGTAGTMACPRCKVSLIPQRYEGLELDQCSFCKGTLLRAGVLERLVTREERTFTPEEIRKAKVWSDSQRGTLKERDSFPEIKCPLCQGPMGKGIHTQLTQVVIDHCCDPACGAVWCDGGELETIQMLVEDAHRNR